MRRKQKTQTTTIMASPSGLQALVAVLVLTMAKGSVSPPQCSFAGDTSTLSCSMRVLNAHNASFPAAGRAVHLDVLCSDVFFFESFLRTNHFGYLPSLESLDLTYCKIRKVPALAFSGLSSLTALAVRSHNSEWSAMIMELEKDALTGLNDLQRLDLTGNNLWSLPEGAFCALMALNTLNISMNSLQDVLDLGFSSELVRSCRLPLEDLDLSDNSLSLVPRNAFGQLPKLRRLFLQGNNVNILKDEAFGGLRALESLNLANNQLVALPPAAFKDMAQLQELYLQNNSLNVLAPGIFSGLNNLLVLNLSRNAIADEWLNGDTFSPLGRLAALDLSHNDLTKLDANLFESLPALQVLYLKHNRIHTVAPNTFSSQRNLHILSLSHNALEGIHPKAIQSLPQLSSLSLDHNKLHGLHKNLLRDCPQLQDLALHNNLMRDVPKALKWLPLLRTMDLGENSISHLKNESFQGLSHLYALRLASNGIKYLQKDLFDSVPTLQALNLAHNQLETLDQGVFMSLKGLRVLRLDNNFLQHIDGLLQAQSDLVWLNISSNRLQWFDYGSLPRSVEWLDAHDNQLDELANFYAHENISFNDNFNLVTLDASGNKIKSLNELSIPNSVRNVYLGDNSITAVSPGTFKAKRQLERVELTSNNLQHLQLTAITAYAPDRDSVPEFFLGDNPFLCDCEMEWLQKINLGAMHNHHPRIMDIDNVKCSLNSRHPNQMLWPGGEEKSLPIMMVEDNQFLCAYQAHCFALCMCCDFFACDCRMQCPEGCSCFHDSTWSANVIQCSMRDHEDIPPLIPMDATAIYLDGNNFTGTLESQAFIGRKHVRYLYLNQSQIEAISNQTFNGLTELEVLHLEDNFIGRLEGYEFQNLTSLRELYLHNNRLRHIDSETFSALLSLKVLHLHSNQLTAYPVWDLSSSLPTLQRISLAGNPWSCQCDFVHNMQRFVTEDNSLDVIDYHRIECVSSEDNSLARFADNITCSSPTMLSYEHPQMFFLPLIIVAAIAVAILLCALTICNFRTALRVWLHSKYGFRMCGKTRKAHVYDAFVSYCVKDKDFVQQVLVPQLEHNEPSYNLCLQHRDLPSSSNISDTLPGVSHLCAKHIFVVSHSYLEMEWGNVKYAMKDFSKKLKPVIVLLEELSTLDLAANPEFNLLLKSSKKVSWSEAGFWNRLRYYLPDITSSAHLRSESRAFRQQHSHATHAQSSSPEGSSGTHSASTHGATEWTYDGVIPSNDSSTSTRSTIMGGSPRTLGDAPSTQLGTPQHQLINAQHIQQQQQPLPQVQLVSNPLDQLMLSNSSGQPTLMLADQWSDQSESAYSNQDHTYQAIPSDSHIYHTLDGQPHGQQAVGYIPVRLPDGRTVSATLVRSRGGELVPVVPVSVASPPTTPLSHLSGDMERVPLQQQQHQSNTMQSVTFPKTVVYRPQQQQQQQQSAEGRFLLQQQQQQQQLSGQGRGSHPEGGNTNSKSNGHLV